MAERNPHSAMDEAFLTGTPDTGELILVRHGQQDFPAAGTRDLAAWFDPPLSGLGLRQADAVGRHLADRPVAAVYTSTLRRAIDTGRAVADQHGLEVITDERLKEIGMFRDLPPNEGGALSVLGEDVLRDAFATFVRTKRWDSYPLTEPGAEFRARVREVIEEIIARHPGEVVVVACHGGVIAGWFSEVLGLEEDMFFRPAHASVHRMAFRDAARVIGTLNEIPHLPGDLLSW